MSDDPNRCHGSLEFQQTAGHMIVRRDQVKRVKSPLAHPFGRFTSVSGRVVGDVTDRDAAGKIIGAASGDPQQGGNIDTARYPGNKQIPRPFFCEKL